MYGYYINYFKYTNNISAQFFRYLLLYRKKTRYYQHTYFWYYRPFITYNERKGRCFRHQT